MAPSWCKLHLVTVEPVLFFFTAGLALQIPTVSALVYHKVCLSRFNRTVCDNLKHPENHPEEDWVQAESAKWYLYLALCYEVPAIFMSFVHGAISDHVSRRLALALPGFGSAVSVVGFLLASVFERSPLGVLAVAQLVCGLFGGWITASLAAFSYLSEVSSREHRTTRTAVAEAVTTLTISVSFFLSGVALDHVGFPVMFALAGGLFLSSVVLAFLWVRPPPQRQPAHATMAANGGGANYDSGASHSAGAHQFQMAPAEGTQSASCCETFKGALSPSHIRDSLRSLFRPRPDNGRVRLLVLLVTIFTSMLSFSAMYTLGYLYVRRRPLSWSQTLYGVLIGVAKLLSGGFLVIGVPLLKYKARLSDTVLLLASLVTGMASEILLAFSNTTWMVFMVAFVAMMTDTKMTSMRSLMSTFVEPDELGRMFAAVGSVQSLSGLVGSLLYNAIYPHTLSFWPGFCFVLGAGLTIIPVALVGWLHWDMRKAITYREFNGDQSTNVSTAVKQEEISISSLSEPKGNQ